MYPTFWGVLHFILFWSSCVISTSSSARLQALFVLSLPGSKCAGTQWVYLEVNLIELNGTYSQENMHRIADLDSNAVHTFLEANPMEHHGTYEYTSEPRLQLQIFLAASPTEYNGIYF